MIPYPHALTTAVAAEELHPLANWNNPLLMSLWALADASPQTLRDDSAQALQALQLPVPSHFAEAEDTLTLIRQGLEALLLKTDRDGVHIDNVLDTVDIADIQATLATYLSRTAEAQPGPGPRLDSLLDHLDGTWLMQQPIAQISAYPMTALVKVLTTPTARKLAAQLRQVLGWMDGDGRQNPSGVMDFKLLVSAVRIQMDPASDLNGFDLLSADLIGLGYEQILERFQQRMLRRTQVGSKQAAVVACTALLAHFPSDFAVLGIPADLPYRSSIRWVQFRHGVELAEAIQAGSSRSMTYRELTNFAMQTGLDATPEQQEIIGMALVHPVILWAKADATLASTLPDELDAGAIQRILQTYLDQDAALQTALEYVSTPPPKRFDIAQQLLTQLDIDPQTPYINRPKPSSDAPIVISRYLPSMQVSALQVITTCHWQGPATDTDKPHVEPLIDVPKLSPYNVLDKADHWHAVPQQGFGGEYFPSWSPGFSGPSALDEFNRRFTPWLRNMRDGYYRIIWRLLSELPAEDQRALREGDVGVYSLVNILKPEDMVGDGEPNGPALFGFVIQTTWQNQTRTFEVLPNTLQIIKRLDVIRLGLHYYETGYWLPKTFDFNAYATGQPPSLTASGTVGLILQFGFISANQPSPIDERVDQGTVLGHQRLDTIAKRASASLIYGTDEFITALTKGQTDHERDLANQDVSQVLKEWVVPFWGSIKDVVEGIKTGDPLRIFLGVLGITFDVLSIIVPGVGAVTQLTRIALLTTARTLRQALVQAVRVSATFLLKSGRDLVPVLSLVDLGVAAGRGTLGAARGVARLALVDGAAKAALVSLRTTIKSIPRRLRQLFTPSSDLMIAWKTTTSGQLIAYGFRQRRVGQQPGVLVYTHHLGHQPANYLVDPMSGRPYGPRLNRLDDAGTIGLRHRPATLRLTREGGGLSFPDPTPDLTKRWVTQNDVLYLEMDGVYYQYLALPDDVHVLRRTRAVESKSLDSLEAVTCRVGRTLDPRPCSPGTYRSLNFDDKVDSTTTGRNVVPWFNNRKITVDGRRSLIDNEARWTIRDNGELMRAGRKKYPAEKALPQIQVTVIAGNDLFKQVEIAGGIFDGVEDTRTVSGVVARHKTSAQKVLVVRADDNLYYRADYAPGQTSLQMQRLTLSPNVVDNAVTEDDFLALIHNGSSEAHRVIARLSPEELAADLKLIETKLANQTDFEVAQFIGGPFDMGTTPTEAALFCKYAQTRLVSHAKDTALYRFALTSETSLVIRNRIADDLNALYRNQQFDANSVITREALREGTDSGKNLAYLHVRFNSSNQPDRLYYSWSGVRSSRSVPLADLEREIRAGTAVAPQDWSLVDEGLMHENVIYINAQPADIPTAHSVLFLPDIQHRSLRQVGKDNTRLLDSERSIVTRIREDALDHTTIASVDAFTVRPTCQSCTIGLDGLKTDMAGVDFNLFEGPA